MNKHLPFINRFLPLIIALLVGFVGTVNLHAQSTCPEGALPKVFSVSNTTSVFFSQGNLQYIGSAETPYWKFADHQWDYLGTTTGQNSGNQNKDRDLFGWGTSGYNHGANCYQPWSTSQNNSDYYAYGNESYNLFNQTGQADWGYNAISNGGNQENSGWRTLSTLEWQYLFDTRSTPSGIRYAKAKVNNVNGVILLPDDWNASYYTLNSTNSSGASYSSNTITAAQWASLEQHGAVFLPSAGYRSGTSVNLVGSYGSYWSSAYYNSSYAWYVYFLDSSLSAGYYSYRYYGQSVRLVFPSQGYSFVIDAAPSPAEGGAVSGAGAYQGGAECTLTATASAGYAFINWIENGVVVSTEATYSFVVTRGRNMVANFALEGNIVFDDANVKALCVANWDTNGDGELSYAEAANVTSLGNVFKNNTDIQSFNELQYFISLGTIGEQAFYGCTELTQITIPEPVTSVGSKAFWNCPALQTVNYNAVNCTSMQTSYNSNIYSVFSSNGSGGAPALKRVVIGSGVQRIPDYAFKDGVDIYPGVTIRSSVTAIGAHAFENCSSITTLSFQSNSTLASIGESAFKGCSALNRALNLPNSLVTLGQYAFYGCTAIPSLTLGTSLETIGGYAFWNCPNLATVDFNATNCTSMVTNSQYSVFNSGSNNGGATPIVTLTIGENVTNIPAYAFRYGSNMANNLVIPNSVTNIGQYAFAGCSGQSRTLTLGNTLASIDQYAFNGCSGFTGNLTLPNSVASIGQYAFNGCSGFNGTLTLPVNESFTTIDQYTFNGCSGLTGTLTIPTNVTEVANSSFRGCSSFTGPLVLHDAVTTIGEYAFYGCSGIPELTIGQGISTIGGYAFWNCPNLATVHFNATNCTSMVTNSQYPVFNSGTNNGGATPIVTLTIGENVTKIPSYAFSNSSLATGNLLLPSGLTNIGQYAFSGCSGFTGDLAIPNSVNTIGQYAFSGCSGFDGSLTVGRGVQTINQSTFANCSGFSGALILGTQVNNIGNYAFQNCSAFSLVISENPNPITATTSSFTGMDFSIPVYVPDGLVSNYQNATGWNNFTNYIEQFTFWDNLDSANWSDEMNWLSMSLPTENSVVCITYNCDLDIDFDVLYVYVYNINDVLTIKANQTLYTTYGVGLMSPSQLVIEEGGQVIYGNGANANATQTIHLEAGVNYISSCVEITLDDLKAALLETFSGTTLTIKSQNKNIRYLPALNRWTGNLTDALFDVASMYVVVTDYEADVTLEGEPVDPADHPVTIVGDGITYLAYPFIMEKTLSEAFAGFAIAGDVVKSQNQNARCVNGNTNRWSGGLSTLEPGKGYKYISNASSNRTFTFPTNK